MLISGNSCISGRGIFKVETNLYINCHKSRVTGRSIYLYIFFHFSRSCKPTQTWQAAQGQAPVRVLGPAGWAPVARRPRRQLHQSNCPQSSRVRGYHSSLSPKACLNPSLLPQLSPSLCQPNLMGRRMMSEYSYLLPVTQQATGLNDE